MRLSSTQSPHKLILQTTHPSHFLAPPPPPPPLLLPFHSSTTILPKHANFSCISNSRGHKDSGAEAARPVFFSGRASFNRLKVNAVGKESDVPEWWEKKSGPNMVDIHSTQDFVDELSKAGDRLVIVDFYGTWCASCRAMFPKLCKTAEMHPEIMFLKVNFDANKSLCKSLNIKVLPYFHFYRGADRLLDSFSCSLAKFQKLKDAIATHNCVYWPSEVDQKLSGQKRLEIPPALNDKPSEPTTSV